MMRMPDVIQRWFEAFSDPAGGFHERLDKNLKPENLPKRLLTQCRQLFVYGSAGMNMDTQYDYMVKNYRNESTGGWRFSQTDDTYDLYAHGFTLLACATLKKIDHAFETASFIDTHFRRRSVPGLVHALDSKLHQQPGPLAQNPHMHLLEGSLAMAEISPEPIYKEFADEIINLFFSHFFDGVVREYHDGEKSNLIEGGHQAEWIWLLIRYRDVLDRDDSRINPAIVSLWDWVHRHGIDKTHGGIINAQTRDGQILDDKKRIWPVCETMRAASIMGDTKTQRDMHGILYGNYMRPDGFWNEVLNRDLTVATDYLPGTTPYHIYQILKLA